MTSTNAELEPYRWLLTSDGASMLSYAAGLPADRLTRISRLRKRVSPEQAALLVEMLELRKRAEGRFYTPADMLLTPQGIEQSTGQRIARYRAHCFPADAPVLDCCCGLGGDALAMYKAGHRVIAADRDEVTAFCAAYNCRDAEVNVLCTDVTALNLPRIARGGVTAAFFDPSRRVSRDSGGTTRRIRDAEEYSPPLSFFKNLMAHFPFAAAKVSPAVDDAALLPYLDTCTVEFCAEGGECKETMLWYSQQQAGQMPPGYRASVIDCEGTGHLLSPDGGPEQPIQPWLSELTGTVPAGMWIYEPQPSVVRAHLTAHLARQLQARFVSANSYYLASEIGVATPFATAYSVLDCLPLHPPAVQKRCAELGLHITAIKTKWDTAEPELLRKQIKGMPKSSGTTPACLLIVTSGKRKFALIVKAPESRN